MNKKQLCVMLSDAATERIEKIADRYGLSRTSLISIVAEEISHVRPDAFFEAMGAIPADLKTRPVGRPAGSTATAKSEKKQPAEAAA